MVARALAALVGCLLALLWPGAWPAAPVVLLAAFGLGLAAVLRGWYLVAFLLVFAALGERTVLSQLRGQLLEPERVMALARVVTIPQPLGLGVQFDADVRLPRRPFEPARRVRVQWTVAGAHRVSAGETWQLALNLRPARAQLNPGALEERRLLWRDHVQLRATVLDGALNQRVEGARGFVLTLRARIAQRILAAVDEPATAGLLAALAVGYSGDIETRQWRFYNLTGITHLIAISGMHVTLFAAVVMVALRRLWGALPRLAMRVRRESFTAAGGLVAACGYALMAGFSVPTQRTLLMLAVSMAWRHGARSTTAASALGGAVIAILVLDPCAVLAAGFWLSCGAVGVILWREAARLRPPSGWRAALRLQFVITGALAPATFGQFSSMPVAGLWVNPVAIPLFSLALVPLVLAASLFVLIGSLQPLAHGLLWIAEVVARPMLSGLASAARTPGAAWQVLPPAWWYPFGLVAVLLMILPLGWRLRIALGVAVTLPLVCGPSRPAQGTVRILQLATATAPIVLVETRRHALLYGTGDVRGTGGARVSNLVLPAALSMSLRRFDVVIAGGLDRDVASGLGLLAARMPGAAVVAGRPASADLPPQFADCATLGSWRWDGVGFDVLPATLGRGCTLRIATAAGGITLQPRVQAAEMLSIARWLDWDPAGAARGRPALWPFGAWNGDIDDLPH